LRWCGVALYCGLIFSLSAQESIALPDIPRIDKLAHVLEYAGLGWLCAYAWHQERPHLSFGAAILFAVFFASLYGASDEWHQAYVPGRFSDWRDWLADTCGGLIGGFLYMLGLHIKNFLWKFFVS